MDTSKPKKPMPKGMLMPKPKAKKIAPVNPMDEDDDYMPLDVLDKKQDKKNRDAAENYEATKTYKKGGSVGSASKRADGCCIKGKTKGRMM